MQVDESDRLVNLGGCVNRLLILQRYGLQRSTHLGQWSVLVSFYGSGLVLVGRGWSNVGAFRLRVTAQALWGRCLINGEHFSMALDQRSFLGCYLVGVTLRREGLRGYPLRDGADARVRPRQTDL